MTLDGTEQRGLKTTRAWTKDEAMGGLSFTGEFLLEQDVLRKYGGPTKLPAYPGVVALPFPYQDHVIVLDSACVAALLNDYRGTGNPCNVYFKLPSMQVD